MDKSRRRQGEEQVHQRKPIMQSRPSKVYLHEWWLVNANGKGLSVGGFAHRDIRRVSLFQSALIVKRHDTTTIETSDGMIIMVGSMINRLRTLENGFPSKVCQKFLLGFPHDWVEFLSQYYSEDSSIGEGCIHTAASEKNNSYCGGTSNDTWPTSLDDLSLTRIRDLCNLRDLDDSSLINQIYKDVLVAMEGRDLKCEAAFNGINEAEISFEKPEDEASKDEGSMSPERKKVASEKRRSCVTTSVCSRKEVGERRSGGRSSATTNLSCHQRVGASTRSRVGVSTRSMTRSMALGLGR